MIGNDRIRLSTLLTTPSPRTIIDWRIGALCLHPVASAFVQTFPTISTHALGGSCRSAMGVLEDRSSSYTW